MTGFKNSFKILCIFILKKCNTAWKPQLPNINHVRPLHMLNNSAEWRVINSLLLASAGRRSLICPQQSTATSQALTSTWLTTRLHILYCTFSEQTLPEPFPKRVHTELASPLDRSRCKGSGRAGCPPSCQRALGTWLGQVTWPLSIPASAFSQAVTEEL